MSFSDDIVSVAPPNPLRSSGPGTNRDQVDLLNASQGVQTKPRVSREQHYAFYKRMKRNNILTESASQYLWHQDDFVTLNPNVIHQRFEGLLYTSRPYLWVSLTFTLSWTT